MQRYRNLGGDSGVESFGIDPDAIRVRFRENERIYRYSHASAGHRHVEEMKRLALAGQGLASYISRHVRDRYEP